MLTISRLLWDPGSVAHIARHRVTIEEVEQVCHGEPLLREGHSGRILVIGPTMANRVLAIILEPVDAERYYVITARLADRKERRLYQASHGGEAE
jgi:uncharacterized DUF497 family protein